LTNQHWVLIDNIESEKQVYLFRPDNELLIAKNGKIEKRKWEYLGNKSLMIDLGDETFLFKHGFFDENLLVLKIDGRQEYAFFINENKYTGDINSFSKVIEFLTDKYLFNESKSDVENQTGIKIIKEEKKPTPEELKEIEERKTKDAEEMKLFSTIFISSFILVALLLLWALTKN
jgi:hypothetical protein